MTKIEKQPLNTGVQSVEVKNWLIVPAMVALSELPAVNGNELECLLDDFHSAVSYVAESPQLFKEMCQILCQVNPKFEPTTYYSDSTEANILANVVAAIYAPLIHGYSATIIKNIQTGILPTPILAPPRDTIPLITSLEETAKLTGIPISIIKPPVTRKTAGIANNQSTEVVSKDPLLDLALLQAFQNQVKGKSCTEIETGIYSTTSQIVAKFLKKQGLINFVALKFYGLGPNLSYIHALLSHGQEWVAENAEINGLVNPNQIAQLMILLDSMEEIGMENFYQSISNLELSDGKVIPVITPVDNILLQIAIATNNAIKETAPTYFPSNHQASLDIISQFPKIINYSQDGFPFTLKAPIPPMDNNNEHFANIRNSQLFSYPKLIL